MTIRDICDIVVCDLIITFDEDPNNGTPDVKIPVSAEPKDILADGVLDLEINLMMAKDDSLWISTNTRW